MSRIVKHVHVHVCTCTHPCTCNERACKAYASMLAHAIDRLAGNGERSASFLNICTGACIQLRDVDRPNFARTLLPEVGVQHDNGISTVQQHGAMELASNNAVLA
eukprot:scaffold311899_cov24-Tisochrysis_lutea.AAC.1